jgi:prevent-host-death family protein
MAVISTEDVVPVTDASKRLPTLVKQVEHSGQKILFKNNRPVAALIGVERLRQLQEAEDALADLALLAARIMTDSGQRTTLDEVLETYGVTREELRELDP